LLAAAAACCCAMSLLDALPLFFLSRAYSQVSPNSAARSVLQSSGDQHRRILTNTMCTGCFPITFSPKLVALITCSTYATTNGSSCGGFLDTASIIRSCFTPLQASHMSNLLCGVRVISAFHLVSIRRKHLMAGHRRMLNLQCILRSFRQGIQSWSRNVLRESLAAMWS
jgi:hypothetical protein